MVNIVTYTADDLIRQQDAFIELICDSTNHGASVNFLAPLSPDIAASYWGKTADKVSIGDIILLAALNDAGNMLGSVQIGLDMPPNGVHRAEIKKLLVHSTARGQGLGKALLFAAEDAARQQGRSMLVLDTEKDSLAETLYRRYGYIELGIMPKYAHAALVDELRDCVFFYKFI
jgi:ribosomal protein S18 acetylase RimI-like enzyme